MKILAVERALPEHRYDQQQLLAAFARQWQGELHNPRRLEQLFENVCVGSRCLALPIERYGEINDFSAANDAYIDVAVDLGARAIARACRRLDVEPRELGQLVFVTSTGVATPSVDARICNRLALDAGLRRTPLFGLGCMAGAAGIARMADFLRANPEQIGVVLSVELCSLTLQRSDFSIANLISSGLFGDGAAAVVMVGGGHRLAGRAKGPVVASSRSVLYPESEGVMGWDIGSQGFRVVLSAEVPAMVRRYLARDVHAFLAAHELGIGDLRVVVAHPGGPKVLQAMQEVLELPPEALACSWRSLKEVGNLSSASVLLILEDALREEDPPAGSYGLLFSMGPGFSSELVLLRW